MALRTILKDTDPALSKVCREITEFDDRLHELLDDMVETLNSTGGVGLAAPQVGILRRCAIVIDDLDNVIELVNPTIIESSDEIQDGLEGCLSVPDSWGLVKRPMHVKVRAQDRHGKFFETEGEELVARCFCHELDHLDGIIFTKHAYKMLTPDELDELFESED